MTSSLTLATVFFAATGALIGLLAGLVFAYAPEIKRGKSPLFQVLIAVGVGCVLLALAALAGELRHGVTLPEGVVWLSTVLTIGGFVLGLLIKSWQSRARR